jgi:predicted transcriptional regulator
MAPKPTSAELAILQILWQRGPSTVRDIHNAWDQQNPVGYTTVLKLLQIMTEKGLVERDERARAHVYKATSDREQTQSHLVRDLVDRVFGGSAAQLAMRALSERKASKKEIAEIREMLDSFEKGNRK